ncbi:MAG: ribonuclease D [Desulfobacteraceae bacterium]|nr:ribonuclease D [Desulfobacteraceae bacterium]MCB9494180.1 ribonuclease D [Desulfobacteraceae bacterium]
MTIIVEHDKDLEKLCTHLKTCDKVGVDLEGDGMYHFREKICLIQLSDGISDWIIDPLRVKKIEILAPFFFDPKILKIFHGADYDIKSLYRDYGIVVNNLFDTEIAARFAGLRLSGLDHLMMDFLGVKTEKKYQKKDWSIRPLPADMLDYAAMDSRYLISIFEILTKKLKSLKRLDWVYEESSNISESRFVKKMEVPYFTSFKGAGKLDRRSLAVLEDLLKFRYSVARKKDKPLYKVIPNKTIIKIAEKKAEKENELKNIMSPGHYKRFGTRISGIVQNAMVVPASGLPCYPKKKKPKNFSHLSSLRSQNLRQWRLEKSEHLELDPGIVLNNGLVCEIAEKNPQDLNGLAQIPLKRWQIREFGKEILNVLSQSLLKR